MVEIHGWITIRDDFKITETDKTEQVAKIIKQEVKKLNMDVKWMNGECYMQFVLYSNHWADDCDDIFDIYKTIAYKAKGSYGLLYIHDDDNAESYNEFIIYRLIRGKLEKFNDNLLSPFVPVVEDKDFYN